ncbi:MAG: glycosyltransferase [Lachnospiraceae bacterium]|nr:glycosyltransferase [Lachnospiraceae bacterium]
MISVIVPVYNVKEEYLRQCVSCIICQEGEIELILVDDGSTDDAGVICDEYAERDVRVRVLHQKNQGVFVARNNGMKEAKGKWLCFVDADDWIEENTFHVVLSSIGEKTPDMVVWNTYLDTDQGVFVQKNYKRTVYLKTEEDVDSIRLRLLQATSTGELGGYDISTLGYPCCHLYLKELIERYEVAFDASFRQGEDKLFNYQYMSAIHSMVYLNEALYHYRQHSQSASHTFFSEHVDNSIRLMNKYLEIEPKIRTDERYRNAYSLRGGYVATLLLGSYYLHLDSTVKRPLKEFRKLMKQEPYLSAIEGIDLSQIKRTKTKLTMRLLKWHMYLPLILYINVVNKLKR